jgi:hypothetical protein
MMVDTKRYCQEEDTSLLFFFLLLVILFSNGFGGCGCRRF